jgi:2-polyprenyl-3-methyl-5-hydroxy-6-metoxy-1,4-benzoquinol methylase
MPMSNAAAQCSIPCNLCGGTVVDEVSLKDRDGGFLRTVICTKCGLVWSDPRPIKEGVAEFYRKDYRLSYKGAYSPSLKHVYRAGKIAEKRFLFLRDPLRPESRILDVGASSGEFVYFLRKLGYDARGIEPNEGYGTYARDELGLPIDIGLVQDFELGEESLDVVTMHHVFEHLEDPAGTLGQIRQALAPDGIVMIEVPNVEGRSSAPGNRFHAAHLYNFNKETLEGISRGAGFEILKTEIPTDGGVLTTLLRKTDVPVNADVPQGNFPKVKRVLDTHTTLSHFTSKYPYLRPLQKLRSNLRESSAVKNAVSGKDVLDAIAAPYLAREKN